MTDARPVAEDRSEPAAEEPTAAQGSSAAQGSPPTSDPTTVSGEPAARPALVDAFGGKRGLFDSSLPVLVFVVANSLATALTDARTGLRVALVAALVGGLVVVAVRLSKRQSLQQALSGFFALALAAYLANRSGEARDFHLPHILWQIAYGSVFLVSVLARRPVVGFIYQFVDGLDPSWRTDRGLRRVFVVATLGWVAVFATRTAVLGTLYLMDRSGYLAAARLVLGWPVTIGAGAATLAYVRRARARLPQAQRGG